MRRQLYMLVVLIVSLSLGLAACGDDSPTQSGDSLSEAEVEVMMEAFLGAGGLFFLGGGFSGVNGDIALQEIDIDESLPCSGGGSVRTTGTLSVSEQGESFGWSLTQTHNSCVETASSNGSTWTFNGAPSISTTFSGSVAESSFNYQGAQTGGIAWSSDGNSGTCQINLSYNMTGSDTSVSVSVTGSVCGHNVSQNTTVST